jgi:hypothetical protein
VLARHISEQHPVRQRRQRPATLRDEQGRAQQERQIAGHQDPDVRMRTEPCRQPSL